jgi:hypothetical protein
MAFKLADAVAVMHLPLQFPPAVIGWNRLEGRPRTEQLDRALRAEVRDALWFLTRQWQFGEFNGEDAGSPVEARTAVRVDPLQHFAVEGQGSVAYDPALALETHAEREPPQWDLTAHAQATRYFWRLIAGVTNLSAARAGFLATWPLAAAAVAGVADADTAHALQLGIGRTLDVRKMLSDLSAGVFDTRVDAFGVTTNDKLKLKQAGRDLAAWMRVQLSQPTDPTDSAWNARFLEYQLAVATDTATRGQTVLRADQYTQGHLDWFAFDVDDSDGARLQRKDGSTAKPSPDDTKPLSFLPAPVSYSGMPNPRYWEMESRQVEFAKVDAHTTDVAKLLLTEFALVYGNDWCVIPYELPVGSVSEVMGIIVTDDFGGQSLLLPAGRGLDDRWQRWSMFTMSHVSGTGDADTRFFLAPAVPKLLEAPPLEKVVYLRDEMANMAWAVERVVQSGLGDSVDGYAVARGRAPAPPPPLHPTTAPVRYVLGTDVPANWFPFIPVHVPGSNRSVQLQRARMPGSERPRYTQLLSPPTPYYLNEEEVPRAGKIVTRGFQRSRWLGGATLTWIGRRAFSGRGEGSSGLAFDQLADVAPPTGEAGPQ